LATIIADRKADILRHWKPLKKCAKHPKDWPPPGPATLLDKNRAPAHQPERYKRMKTTIHPALAEFTAEQIKQDHVLRYFHYSHLAPALQESSKPFCELARHIVETLPRNPERTVALRKLLEAKDAAVRTNVS
jgi:hypothetical protein